MFALQDVAKRCQRCAVVSTDTNRYGVDKTVDIIIIDNVHGLVENPFSRYIKQTSAVMSLLSIRVGGVRVFDTVLSILILWWFFAYMSHGSGCRVSRGLALALLTVFPLAIFFHALFRVPTFINCSLGLADPVKCKAIP